MAFRLAIDVGGTFTDVVVVDDRDGTVHFGKVLSTPADPSGGSLAGAREILERVGIAPGDIAGIVHATTVATNAVLEGKGARTGLVTTAGFRDVLETRRESRYDIYDLGLRLPPPLVPRPLRTEATERCDHTGAILVALDEEELRARLRELVERDGVTSLAVAFLHSYANPAHERRVAAIAAQLFPDLEISLSHSVAGEVREFERTSTVVVDAYVKPLVRRYVGRLSDGLKALGITPAVSMMLSHGGIGPATEVVDAFPVRMIESGPAAGAIAAAYFARQALPEGNAVAFDMGGTTAKMSLIRNGAPTVTQEYEVAHVHRFKRGSGYPLQISAIELLEIGAGGGSIARVNELGLLNVGPHSAGAAPGPACYGRGGTEPTVTDADLLLGYLDAGHFLGGAMALDRDASRRAIEEKLAPRLGMAVDEIAWGIHNVVNESMAAATRAHAVERGVDLRRFSLVAFGGAGPVHAYAIARKLGIGSVLCPFGAGVASSIGCLVAPPAVDLVAAHAGRLDELDWDAVARRFGGLHREGEGMLAALLGPDASTRLRGAFEMRCEGQGYSIVVALPEDSGIGPAMLGAVQERFAATYAEIYGHHPPRVALEVVSLRARIEQPSAERPLRLAADAGRRGTALKAARPVYFEAAGGFVETRVWDRYALPGGETIAGPAIVEERETSIAIGPDARFRVDPAGHVVIDIGEPA